MTRILVADDHPIVRDGIRAAIQGAQDLEVTAEAENGREALRLLRTGAFELAVLDIVMPEMSGLEVLEHVHEELPKIGVVVFSAHEEETYALRALKMGASAYLSKRCKAQDLVTALRTVAAGKVYVTSSLAERMAMVLAKGGEEPSHETLSNRELSVMIRIAQGQRLDEIAKELFVSPKTISTYRVRVLRKLGLKNNVELARYVVGQHLLP